MIFAAQVELKQMLRKANHLEKAYEKAVKAQRKKEKKRNVRGSNNPRTSIQNESSIAVENGSSEEYNQGNPNGKGMVQNNRVREEHAEGNQGVRKGAYSSVRAERRTKDDPKEIKHIWDFAESFMLLQGKPED